MKEYTVFLSDRAVGDVCVTKEGLYYRFQCHCDLPDNKIFRIFAQGSKQRIDLGILAPDKAGYALIKKVPIKQFGEELLSFQVCPQDQKKSIAYNSVVIYQNRPFDYIRKLPGALLNIENGSYCVLLQK